MEGSTSSFEVQTPPTIQALLAARLEQLSPEQQVVIERASLEGQVFHIDAVMALSPPYLRAGVADHLVELERKGLIIREPDSNSLKLYSFHHILFRDVVYESTPKGLRAELHVEFADWLLANSNRPSDVEEVLGLARTSV